jgi:endonuclease VIII-like 1
MPELAEIRIMADYINSVCDQKDFTSIAFSESANSRGLGIVQPSDLQIFSISAEAKGKELMVSLIQGERIIKISFSMGMSGYWKMIGPNEEPPKHTHFKFNSISFHSLCLVDVRRFAKWKQTEDWSKNRGPCPVNEHDSFLQNITESLSKSAFSKPICEVLLDQRYFNGIGNYLRAEILYRASQDPFEEARKALSKNPLITKLCKRIPLEAYQLGGGQLKDWESPFKIPRFSFEQWIKCYGKSQKKIDGTGRAIWYHDTQLKPKVIS